MAKTMTKNTKKRLNHTYLVILVNILLYVVFLALSLMGSPFRIFTDISRQPIGLPTINYAPIALLVMIDLVFLYRGKERRGQGVIGAIANAFSKYLMVAAANTFFYVNTGLSNIAKNIIYWVIIIILFAMTDYAFFAFLKRLNVSLGKVYYWLIPLLLFMFGAIQNIYYLVAFSVGTPASLLELLAMALGAGLITLVVGRIFRKSSR